MLIGRPVSVSRNRLGSVSRDGATSAQMYGEPCSTEADIKEALAVMRNNRVRRLPVIELDGLLLGIISISDVVLCAGAGGISNEEIVATYKAICEPSELASFDARPPTAAVA